MKKTIVSIFILTCLLLISSITFAADSGSCKRVDYGDYSIYRIDWSTDDGTFDKPTTIAGGMCEPVSGIIISVQFDGGAANQPDSSYSVYLYTKNFNFDYLAGTGATLDGTTRTAAANVRTPLTTDGSYLVVPGFELSLYVSGPGAGTRTGTVYVTVKDFDK